jgi:hypothetical protein
MDFKVAAFEVDAYIGWGTPNDYETFKYWQSFFHKTPSHPYSLELDSSVNQSKILDLKASIYGFKQDYRQ